MWLLKVWSVPTQLPYRSEISQFHTTDHETALSHQPALASAAVRCALLSCLIYSPRIFFSTSNLLILIETLGIYIWCIMLSVLHVLSFCCIASFPVKQPSVYCFIDLRWTKGCLVLELLNKGRMKGKKKRVDMPPCCSCTECWLFTHFIGANY